MPRHDMMNRSFADGDGRTIDGDGCIEAKTIVFCMELWGVSREWHEVKGNLGRFP
jgi:hypothetical protein